MKLLRPLHRQRTRRTTRATVLNRSEVASLLEIDGAEVETYLCTQGIGFHRDSRGEIWVSWPDANVIELPASTTD